MSAVAMPEAGVNKDSLFHRVLTIPVRKMGIFISFPRGIKHFLIPIEYISVYETKTYHPHPPGVDLVCLQYDGDFYSHSNRIGYKHSGAYYRNPYRTCICNSYFCHYRTTAGFRNSFPFAIQYSSTYRGKPQSYRER